MRIVFIGSTRRGYLTLEALAERAAAGAHELVGVVSLAQFPNETDRFEGQIAALAAAHDVPLVETQWMKDRDYRALILDEWQADLAVLVGVRILLPDEVWTAVPRGCWTVHDSPLPAYRGFAPMNWAILNGEAEAAVTLFVLSEEMDAGDVIARASVPIGPRDDAPTVYRGVCDATVRVIVESLALEAAGGAPRTPQDDTDATYGCARITDDGWLDWRQDTAALDRQIRALAPPWPCASTTWRGRTLLVHRAEPAPTPRRWVGRVPGRIVGRDADAGWVDVLTGDGTLRLHTVQRPGKAPRAAASLIKSVRASLGSTPWQQQSRIEALEAEVKRLAALLEPEG